MTLPRASRLRLGRDFADMLQGARRRHGPDAVILVARAPADPRREPPRAGDPPPAPTRFAVSASRKVGPAVVRNRLKRVWREGFRAAEPGLPPGCRLWVQLRHTDRPGAVHPEHCRRRLLAAAGVPDPRP